ncbi:MAG: N-acetylmuramidase family protein [Alistipes sp.]|nr:N-acetylmuramidase family protein [Alistipes sp.]
MELLKKGCAGSQVSRLQELLKKKGYPVGVDGLFGEQTRIAVKMFQEKSGLSQDGIVGRGTWSALTGERPAEHNQKQSSQPASLDFAGTAKLLEVDEAAVRAVCEVESGGRTGFQKDGRPMILFEGHIFWKELSKRGIDPQKYQGEYADVLFRKWDRSKYLGGEKEHDRLNRAMLINEDAALCSASWGMFQIMGFNHKLCGYETVKDYVEAIKAGPNNHLVSFARFLKSTGLDKPLRELNWRAFASGYNGPGYEQNNYHTKLQQAYEKYKLKNDQK